MPVVIEELDVAVQPPAPAPQPEQQSTASTSAAVDERAVLALIEQDAWRRRRLAAD